MARFWVYGVSDSTEKPMDPLEIEVEDERAARAHAATVGMRVHRVETTSKLKLPHDPDEFDKLRAKVGHPDFAFAQGLIVTLRVLAGIVAVVFAWRIWSALEQIKTMKMMQLQLGVEPQTDGMTALAVASELIVGTAIVAVLFAVAEVLRIIKAIERQTRKEIPHVHG